jgi:hypothetical protein
MRDMYLLGDCWSVLWIFWQSFLELDGRTQVEATQIIILLIPRGAYILQASPFRFVLYKMDVFDELELNY